MIATDLRGVKAANLLNCGVTCVFRDFNLAGRSVGKSRRQKNSLFVRKEPVRFLTPVINSARITRLRGKTVVGIVLAALPYQAHEKSGRLIFYRY
jgi:hypothetical protein